MAKRKLMAIGGPKNMEMLEDVGQQYMVMIPQAIKKFESIDEYSLESVGITPTGIYNRQILSVVDENDQVDIKYVYVYEDVKDPVAFLKEELLKAFITSSIGDDD